MPALADQPTGVEEAGDSVYWQILHGVTETIRDLALPGIPRERVHHATVPVLDGKPTPCVLVTKTRERFDPSAGTNARDDVSYGVLVILVRASSRTTDGDSPNTRQLYSWRERVLGPFLGKRATFPLVGGCHIQTRIADGDPLIESRWLQQLDVQTLTLNFVVRVDRA